MSAHSVRLALLLRLHGLANQVVERLAQHLRENDIDPHSRTDQNLRNAALCAGASEGQMEVAVDIAGINEEIGTGQRGFPLIHDSPAYIAYTKRLAAPNHNFISHQKSPIGKIYDVSSLNARNAGVQP